MSMALVVKTRFKGNAEEPVFVYFLLENKSYIPVRPAFQLLRYIWLNSGMIWKSKGVNGHFKVSHFRSSKLSHTDSF